MGCDYFFDKNGEFEIELSYEVSRDTVTEYGVYRKKKIAISGMPDGRIYEDILKGTCR